MSSRRLVAYLMFAIAAGMLCNAGAITALIAADTYDFAAYYYAGRAALDGDNRLLWAGFGALLSGAYHPAGYVLRVGQIAFVIAAVILISLKLANVRSDLASGAVLGVELMLKPVCAPLLRVCVLARADLPCAEVVKSCE